VTIKLEMNSSI